MSRHQTSRPTSGHFVQDAAFVPRRSPRRQTRWTDRLRLLSMGSGTSLTIMTASLVVGDSPKSNNNDPMTTCTGHLSICSEL
ncbi:hypothetical protein TNCV_1780001 [Trichonephila clavipes]|nr:hypothetical protein TNCV_1780001 [Trichonephila clavipes]